MPARRRPKFKMMCSPDFRAKIRCKMVSIGKWSNHRTVQRTRFKRKPQIVQKNNQELNNWSSWKAKKGMKRDEKQGQKDTWKPLTNLKKHESTAQKALDDIHEEIEKHNLKTSGQKENWKPLTHYEKQTREARSKDNKIINGTAYKKQIINTQKAEGKHQKEPPKTQKFRFGSEGKILTIKGAQISIFPPKKKNKSNPRMFFS
jgi:hypothetical protein